MNRLYLIGNGNLRKTDATARGSTEISTKLKYGNKDNSKLACYATLTYLPEQDKYKLVIDVPVHANERVITQVNYCLTE